MRITGARTQGSGRCSTTFSLGSARYRRHCRRRRLMFLGAANRDPRHWEQPDEYDITRRTTGHVGFGSGIHQCVGQLLAGRRVRALGARPQGRGDRDHRPAAAVLQQHIACIGQAPGEGTTRVATIYCDSCRRGPTRCPLPAAQIRVLSASSRSRRTFQKSRGSFVKLPRYRNTAKSLDRASSPLRSGMKGW
jgi:hypothetical protein